MNFTRTATTDGFGRSVQITNGRFVATMMTGLLPVADMVSRIQLLAPFEQALEQTHKPKDRSLYSAGAMFQQRVFAHICGFEDLADHDVITEDEGFLSALGVNDAAGSSTLCRFENSITRHDLDRLNCCFLDALLRANRKQRIFPRAGARKTPVLIIDVDSTHVDLYGNQEGKSYNAHYQCNCLAPVVCFLNGWPLAVFNAGGTTDARREFEHHVERLFMRLTVAFPNHKFLLRADSGFNSNKIIDTCNEYKVGYVIGFSPNPKTQKMVKENGLKNLRRKMVKQIRRKAEIGL